MMRYSGQRVFVTGGAGVIGDTLVRALHAEGANVLVGDLKPRPSDWPGDIAYRQGDLNDLQAWELAAFAPTVIFHLAATFERSVETFEFWDENFRHNLRLSHHLGGLMRGCAGLRRVVFASSYLVYDPDTYIFDHPADAPVILSEEHRIQPRNLCGGAKLIHELELSFLQHFDQTQFTAAAARIFRSYGRGSRDVISRWVRAALKGEPIDVFNPEGLFDYVYADDVAEGLLRLGLSDHVGALNLTRGRAR
ncbi:MAG TPA: NAD-dependent epimerase/dehydratase family protein, partial [Phenylobacterium sp.]